MPDPSIAAVLAAVILIGAAIATFRHVRRLQRLVAQLQQRLRSMEEERIRRPALHVAFEFDSVAREALVHVTNNGGDADVSARIAAEGELSHDLPIDALAVWRDDGGASRVIRSGETGTMRIAQLDVSVFPYAQWQVYGVSNSSGGGELTVRAMHTSMIGGDPETHAPAIVVQVVLACAPSPATPVPHCTIALRAFDAVRLGSL